MIFENNRMISLFLEASFCKLGNDAFELMLCWLVALAFNTGEVNLSRRRQQQLKCLNACSVMK